MKFRRRTLLGAGLGFAGAAVLGGATGCSDDSPDQTAELLPSLLRLPERFQVPFAVPPVKVPTSTGGGVTRYQMVQRTAQVEIVPGFTTQIYGYDGLFPGPTIHARRGEKIVVNHRNTLDVPTVVHLHGGHTPSTSDGYPIDLVLPEGGGATHAGHATAGHARRGDVSHGNRDYIYPNDQPAATLWYHDHRMDFTAPQVWRGLAGLHLISDDIEDALPLPKGDRDVPLMIMDRAFEANGALRYPSLDRRLLDPPGVRDDYVAGVLGDVILVNGKPWPLLEVTATRYRFRILNASNARRYGLQLSPAPTTGPSFVQIGSDGGLLGAPRPQTDITISPAERYDVIVDFAAYPIGTEVTLTNVLGSQSTDAVMRFRITGAAPDDSRIPATLTEVPALVPSPRSRTREWRFARGHTGEVHWMINNLPFDPARMDARVPLGEVETWRFYSDLHHPVHVHLAPFQVLSRGGRDPGPLDSGWKDTVDLRPTEYVEVAIRFSDFAGKYLIHCHNLEHEDMMMMSAFETVPQS